MTLAARMKARMAEKAVSQAELARQVGVAQPTIAKLMNGASRSSGHLHRIARVLETTPAYLSGETDDPDMGALPLPTLESVIHQFGQVMVPLVDLAAGSARGDPGGANDADPTGDTAPARFEPFRRDRLEPLVMGGFSDLFACEASGDAMVPTLMPGALCLVDRAQTEIREQDRIWAVGYAGMTMLRRVRRAADRGYRLLADNPVVIDIEADGGEVTILGRVVWQGGPA